MAASNLSRWLALGAYFGCSTFNSKPVDSAALKSSAASTSASNASPGNNVEPRFALEVWASVHGSTEGPLRSGMAVHSGDRIELAARTTSTAQVYLLYCNFQRKLVMLPSSGAIAMVARERQSLPAKGACLQLDSSIGNESIYVVASRYPLERTDPRLAQVLSGTGYDNQHADCNAELADVLAGPKRDENSTKSEDASPSATDLTRVSKSKAASKLASPAAWTVRGIEVIDADESLSTALAGDDGIVVLRFTVRHYN